MKNNVSRRSFVRTGAVAAAALSLAAPAVTVEAEKTSGELQMAPFRLGQCSYTFRNFDRTQMIGFLKQMRVTALNAKDVKDHLPMDPGEEAKAVADYAAAGIQLDAIGTVYFAKDEDEDIRSKFEYAKRAGVKVIVAGDPTPETLPRIEKFVKEYDIRFALHNHGPEDKLWHSPLDVLKAMQHMDPRMGCCIDVGHTERAGTDVVEAIHAAGPRLFDVHMKDLEDLHAKESQVAVGRGLMPVREIFQALLAIHYQGHVDLEYEIHGDDPLPGATESQAYMRGVLAGMGYKA
ncbi:MAG: sugar phosphate isomerase/epimerase [Acidobacteriota bacterium]|nr:sugar phosphate isomerase/epimerase [Acidobacteriota bacterium]